MKEEKEGRDKRRRSRNWVEGRDWIFPVSKISFFLVVARKNWGNVSEGEAQEAKGEKG